jgi:translation initiation factor 2B subunit (eIF-2B alpha/beta/delta family)
MFEGRLLAIDLVKEGIKVKLITDAMMGLYVNEIDAAIIGADEVLNNGNIINKVGSKALALLCKDQKKPLYVVSLRSKFSNKKYYKPKSENPNEVWDKKNKNFSVQNIYFEEIEKKLITKVVTD